MSALGATPHQLRHVVRGDDSVFLTVGDPKIGYHEQFDFYGSKELAAKIECTFNAHEALLALARQYRNDLRYPPAGDSRVRRLEAIDAVLALAKGDSAPAETPAPLVVEFVKCLHTMSNSRAGLYYDLPAAQKAKERREETDALARARVIWTENPDLQDDLRKAFKAASPLATMSEIENAPAALAQGETA